MQLYQLMHSISVNPRGTFLFITVDATSDTADTKVIVHAGLFSAAPRKDVVYFGNRVPSHTISSGWSKTRQQCHV